MSNTIGYAERSYLRGYRRGAANQLEPTTLPPETHSGAFANGYRDGQADYAKARRRASERAVMGVPAPKAPAPVGAA